jgi:hypothetical protein
VANVDREFGRVGAWDQVRGADVIEEALTSHPLSPPNHLVFHQRNVRGGAAEPRCSQPQKEQRELA